MYFAFFFVVVDKCNEKNNDNRGYPVEKKWLFTINISYKQYLIDLHFAMFTQIVIEKNRLWNAVDNNIVSN